MNKRHQLGKWRPDLPPMLLSDGLTRCENVIPHALSYAPVGALTNLDSFALSAAPRGVLRGSLSDGTNLFFAGTSTTIERLLETGWSDVSRSSGYQPISQDLWSSAQYREDVFFTNRADALQVFAVGGAGVFEDVTDAPRAGIVSTVETFLMLGDIIDPVNGVQRDAVAWSGINAPRTWPTPGTLDATLVLSGQQRLEGDGGPVQGIVSGAEVAAIFQENAVHRADFVGNDIVWRFSRVETQHGLIVREAAVSFERKVFYLSRDGFRVFNYTSSQNIGKDVVNDFFFADWDQNYPDSVTMRKDPNSTRIYTSYASKTATNGVADRILVWDYALDQWSLILPGAHYGLVLAGGIAASLDSPDTTDDPDRIAGTPADDTVGSLNADTSFDDRQIPATTASLGAFDSSFRLATFSGASLPGVLETGDVELVPGFRSLVNGVRPLVDGEETTVQVASIPRRGVDTTDLEWSIESDMEDDGVAYFREDGRYHRFRFLLPKAMTEASAFDVEFFKRGTQ